MVHIDWRKWEEGITHGYFTSRDEIDELIEWLKVQKASMEKKGLQCDMVFGFFDEDK